MKCLFCVCIILVFTSVIADRFGGKCDRCIPVQECPMVLQMTRSEQERWFEKYSCDQPAERDDVNIPFGFAPLAKGDYVCCPGINSGLQKSVQTYPGIALNDDLRTPTYKEKNNNQPDERYVFGDVDSIESQTKPSAENSNARGNQAHGIGSNERRGINNNNFLNRRPDQRPNNRITNPTQNPYFIPQNPRDNVQQNDNQNSFGNRRIGNSYDSLENSSPFGVGHRDQCMLTNFPPEPNSGCCGRDPSDSDRIIGTPNQNNNPIRQPSQVSSWFPTEEPGLGGFFQDLFGFPRRSKRAVDANATKITIGTRITGGKVTDIDQFPWLVLLQTKFNYGDREAAFNCGGSLISAKYVLTAAHCIHEEGARVSDVEITLAEYDKRTFPNDCINTVEGRQCIENIVMHAEDAIAHPDYDDQRLRNDIALLRLRGKAPYTDFIRPICLPPIDIDNPDFTNIPLSVAGWGRNGIYNSDIKQSTVLNLVPQRECRRFYSQLTRRHLCAAGYTGEDTCKGDSGGPLMILYEGKYFISGIVSGKRADSPCGTSVPSLYTNVYQYLDWIKSIIKN